MSKKNTNTPATLKSNAETRRIYSVVFDQKEASPQTILITSGWRGEGKTTLACNLAALAAQEKGKKVLIIDYNWFAPKVHTQFNLPEVSPSPPSNDTGHPLDKAVQVSGMNNLSVLTAAAFSHADSWKDACSSTHLSGLLNEAKERYDHIFLDASAVFPTNRNMNDPMLLGKAADGVILIALTNVTPKSKTKRACCRLQASGALVIGVVANQWRNPLSL
ncbi:tyrosine-protein kinase YwqD [Desulfoluna limicola]|uniref:Tyrosine-protein kinase YwqD n=1 Tax=Desulfoluna limicola TaxID=2810562 RepID=A0ABM7PHM6_9BACT|nr:AAA family ATPase [Desulfoluna limicola]BCS97076.1 tyrosine-protein kinase YwqD [Desulfoluna limicola]